MRKKEGPGLGLLHAIICAQSVPSGGETQLWRHLSAVESHMSRQCHLSAVESHMSRQCGRTWKALSVYTDPGTSFSATRCRRPPRACSISSRPCAAQMCTVTASA